MMQSMAHIPSNRDRLAIKLFIFLEQMQIFISVVAAVGHQFYDCQKAASFWLAESFG